jgi:plastocyanin
VCTKLAVGSTVTWTNSDATQHNVTFDNTSVGNSPTMDQGATFSKTFTTAATYEYRCTLHPSMTGSIQIQ